MIKPFTSVGSENLPNFYLSLPLLFSYHIKWHSTFIQRLFGSDVRKVFNH